ncbi:MAG: TonB-dependent receptor [Prevotellaceae bacterium]|jgi:TonB-linked SusC/RagA family outer membrane protein|nr:TonB-dependent receptor [Prevotellaceae bacterium]
MKKVLKRCIDKPVFLMSMFIIMLSLPVFAQQGIRISGSVHDIDDQPLSGVYVALKGTTQGTITDDRGEYSLPVSSDTATLVFSLVGFQTQEVKVGNRRIIAVILKEEIAEIGEVTVVAFGTQKKESVIGSITTINPAELKIPSSNLTTALAGNMAGIIAYQRSGEPGRDNADFFVRGITTFGANTNPLILIDNVELTSTDLARLQPDDIASFSIMKDATATALYGARGANGVILVTTKRGMDGAAKIFVRLENSISTPTSRVELADPITYMKMHNEAVLTRNPLGELPYSQDKIENTLKPGYNQYIYPANDWYNMLFNDYAMNQRANLSVTGGGAIARYYVSGAFTQDNGVLKVDKRNTFNNNIDFKNYSLRANVDVNITKKTELSVRLTGNFDDYTGPTDGGEAVYKMVMRSNPVMFPAYYPPEGEFQYVKHIMFGNVPGIYNNPYAEMVRGYQDRSRSQMLAQLELRQDLDFITKGLFFKTMMNISRLAEHSVVRAYKPYWYHLLGNYDSFTGEYSLERLNEDGTEYLDFTEKDPAIQSSMYTETSLNYANTFGKHSVSALMVLTTHEGLDAFQGSLQLSLPSRNAGLAGRATYSYDSRYFAEFNFGYNGSERFAANHRWGFFPSAGAGWMISNEKFWDNLRPVVNLLKLRYSYGLVGNDQIGDANDRFLYISRVNMEEADKGGRFGENLDKGSTTGIKINSYASDDITWETSTKQNIALELGLWKKINLIAEYFTEERRNILMTRAAIPSTMGLQADVRANVGEASAHGVDIQSDYQQSWSKNFWTAARFNFTYSTSKFKVYEEPEYKEYWRSHLGQSLAQNYGYIAERLFMDDAEALNSPSQMFGGEYGGGDIKYTDVNRDGQITPADKVPIGNPTSPEIIYGFGLSAGYKGFDVSVFFQGLANESFWISLVDDTGAGTISTAPFQNQTQLLKAYADSHWSEEHQDMYALWPRFSNVLNQNNTQTSTWFMRNGSFLRLKQAEIGYTIQGKWQKKLHIDQLRFYVSGTNLLLFSKFKLWDVEMAGFGLGYPVQRVFNVGINLTFN